MKKNNVLIAFFIISIVFSACGNDKDEQNWTIEHCEYTIDKEVIFTKNSTGANVAEISFEVPVFSSDKYKLIAESMDKKKEDFFELNEESFTFYVLQGEKSDYREGDFPYYCTSSIEKIHYMNGYCSVLTNFRWYAGGISSYDLIPYNFSVESGDEITLDEICQIQEDELKKTILKELDKKGMEYDESLKDTINVYDMDDFRFYFDDTGIYVVFMTGEISCYAGGCITIPVMSF